VLVYSENLNVRVLVKYVQSFDHQLESKVKLQITSMGHAALTAVLKINVAVVFTCRKRRS
jgi:hypothetical protein